MNKVFRKYLNSYGYGKGYNMREKVKKFIDNDSLVQKYIVKGDYVMIRTFSAGVHVGILNDISDCCTIVMLTNTRRIWNRRIWKWSGAFTLSELSKEGAKNQSSCKFSDIIDKIVLTNVVEIIPMTKEAVTNIYSIEAFVH